MITVLSVVSLLCYERKTSQASQTDTIGLWQSIMQERERDCLLIQNQNVISRIMKIKPLNYNKSTLNLLFYCIQSFKLS